MIDLRNRIKEIIDNETKNGRFSVLSDEHIEILQRIFNNYEVTNDLKQDFENIPKSADLVFIAGPTGAGKDDLVIRFNKNNPDKKYIELNMDMFRYYFKEYIPDVSVLKDRTFASQTNEFSYEMYYTVQEILLTEFPGTNIIITGTLWQTDWVEETFKKYKENQFTNYNISLVSLAVPSKDSAFSIIRRYVSNVNKGIIGKDSEGNFIYAEDFAPGTARYTSLSYHNETFNKFPENLEYFQKLFMEGKYIDSMEVYRRSAKEMDYSEDTLMYSSKTPEYADKTALEVVNQLRASESQITQDDLFNLFDLITDEKNKRYFKEQNVLIEIVHDLAEIFDRGELFENRMNLAVSNKKPASPPTGAGGTVNIPRDENDPR